VSLERVSQRSSAPRIEEDEEEEKKRLFGGH
jgi:hypothetical protein